MYNHPFWIAPAGIICQRNWHSCGVTDLSANHIYISVVHKSFLCSVSSTDLGLNIEDWEGKVEIVTAVISSEFLP